MYGQKTLGLFINTFSKTADVNLAFMIAPAFSASVRACRPRILPPCLDSSISLFYGQYEGSRSLCIQSKYNTV